MRSGRRAMILHYWHGPEPNFGDELNALLWPGLLPDFFDGAPEARFLGIGSIVDGWHDPSVLTLVAGAGYGGYQPCPVPDASWRIHWVRGPWTARHLGLAPSLGIGDPASLVPLAGLNPPRPGRDIGFIPHFESAMRGAWRDAATAAGLRLIDPRDRPDAIIAAMGQCRLIISEALHGVIVADALRIPWIAIEPLSPLHRPKWRDWAASLELTVAFQPLCPSTMLERAWLTPLARVQAGRRLLDRGAKHLRAFGRSLLIEQAAGALAEAATAAPQLSPDRALDRGQTRMLETIETIRRAPAAPARAPGSGRSSPLRKRTLFAYHESLG